MKSLGCNERINIILGNRNTPQLYKKDSPNKKNEIEIQQQIIKIIPQLKNWGNTGNNQFVRKKFLKMLINT